tara:strand:+ start:82 stop:405 length:324 start_codon:yes stop_codon:yes gene_type:complete
MAVTWTITNTEFQLKSDFGDNLMTTLHWQCTDSETVDGVIHSGRSYGSIGIPEPSGTFIEYSKVTEEQAKKWLLAVIGDDQVKATEDSVVAQIATSKAPVMASGVPW